MKISKIEKRKNRAPKMASQRRSFDEHRNRSQSPIRQIEQEQKQMRRTEVQWRQATLDCVLLLLRPVVQARWQQPLTGCLVGDTKAAPGRSCAHTPHTARKQQQHRSNQPSSFHHCVNAVPYVHVRPELCSAASTTAGPATRATKLRARRAESKDPRAR